MNRYSILLTAAVISLSAFDCGAQGTAFTYQGRLTDGSNAYTGSAEFQPTLWNDPSAGSQVAANNPATVIVPVTNGMFVLPLNFNNAPFGAGADRWLQLDVRTTIGPFITLTPRQKLTPTPYAITAANVVSGGIAAGSYSNVVTFNNAANSFHGSFTGSGAGLSNVNATTLGGLNSASIWRTTGNAGTTPGVNFLGTTDNQPLEFFANGQRALRLEPRTNGAPNVIGGAAINSVAAGAIGATIAGGGAVNFMGGFLDGPSSNHVSAIFGTIGGGRINRVEADHATIAGGLVNTIQFQAFDSVIAGGSGNTIQSNAAGAVVGGGYGNVIGGYASAVGGGSGNRIEPGSDNSVIAGGSGNAIRTNTVNATIAGGSGNTIGGFARYATIPGGENNVATGWYSFAAGRNASANHDGAFVWADGTGSGFSSTSPNQFLIKAEGGVGIDTPNPQSKLDVRGDIRLGSTGQYLAPGGEENLRIIRGVIDAAGNTLAGSGFAVSKTGTGAYTVTFNTQFNGLPAVTATVQSGLSRLITCTSVANGSAQFRTFVSSNAAPADHQFHFSALGPR